MHARHPAGRRTVPSAAAPAEGAAEGAAAGAAGAAAPPKVNVGVPLPPSEPPIPAGTAANENDADTGAAALSAGLPKEKSGAALLAAVAAAEEAPPPGAAAGFPKENPVEKPPAAAELAALVLEMPLNSGKDGDLGSAATPEAVVVPVAGLNEKDGPMLGWLAAAADALSVSPKTGVVRGGGEEDVSNAAVVEKEPKARAGGAEAVAGLEDAKVLKRGGAGPGADGSSAVEGLGSWNGAMGLYLGTEVDVAGAVPELIPVLEPARAFGSSGWSPWAARLRERPEEAGIMGEVEGMGEGAASVGERPSGCVVAAGACWTGVDFGGGSVTG